MRLRQDAVETEASKHDGDEAMAGQPAGSLAECELWLR